VAQTSPVCHKTDTLPQIRQCHRGSRLWRAPFWLAIPLQVNKFRSVGKLSALAFLMHSPRARGFAMSGMRGLNGASDSESVFSRKRSHSRILEIDTWMPSDIHAISPTVDRLMRLIEGSQCVHTAERDVEMTLREALGRSVVHGNQADSKTKVHIRCRCGPGSEITIVVTRATRGTF